MLLPLLLNNLLQAGTPPEPPAPGITTGSNKRRPQIQWLPAHVPYVEPQPFLPRRRTRKARDEDLLFLGQ